jgi:sugar-specific transcriptional regulator TrmB
MDVATLVSLGLNETQAKAYIAQVKHGSVTPPQLATLIGITRTNAYAVLDQLVELGLTRKQEMKKKLVYRPENPVALEQLARKSRQQALERERTVQAALPTLLNYFYTFSEQPGIKFYQGADGIKEIYNDTLRTNKDIYVVRSQHDQDLMSLDFYDRFKQRRAKLGIKTFMLNPSTDSTAWNADSDALNNIDRTAVRPQDYTSKVELATYGDKTSVISFGEEAIGMIIESPQVADAMRQLFQLAKRGAEANQQTSAASA